MRIELACFTEQGRALGKTLARGLEGGGDSARVTRCGGDTPLRKWVAGCFGNADALIFIGAVGIAVRAVAPEIVSKTSDPAVLAVDERGRFVISLLSGHIGGANELAGKIAPLIGAAPVVTSATDVNKVFAIDTWARRNGLAIVNPEKIKMVSSRLLAGDRVGVHSPFPLASPLPRGLVLADNDVHVFIDVREPPSLDALLLAPPVAALGVGCRKGASAESIEKAFSGFCASAKIRPEAFGKVCSIDLKRNEPGLAAFCGRRRLPLETFSAEALMEAEGSFDSSDFVRAATGADNVCERSAVVGAGVGGRLLAGKTVARGVTMAAAIGGYELDFGGDGNRP